MDKPRRQVRWRGSRKTLSHELAPGSQVQGALFGPPPEESSPVTMYRYRCAKCGRLWAQEKCFVPERCIVACGGEGVYLGMKAGMAESKAAVLNEAINLPASDPPWIDVKVEGDVITGCIAVEIPRVAHTNDPFDDYEEDEEIPFPE